MHFTKFLPIVNAIIVDVQSLSDVAFSEVCDWILNKLQDIPALSSEGYEPVTAELDDASPIHLLFHILETSFTVTLLSNQ